ncbi:MAG: hypothetical protein AUG51_18305 [Acidobacteria bacterium 13_1_20CM_3_53_8]|nr:MAG: hypothetical protein AUG51_18305 [Acidobacteria bacterium 13_1_20CM_3_53_8]
MKRQQGSVSWRRRCVGGDKDVVQLLIESGADMNMLGDYGSALAAAVGYGGDKRGSTAINRIWYWRHRID